MTLANGKRLIQQFAQVMRLGNDHVEVANRFFQQAVQRSFIQGCVCLCVCNHLCMYGLCICVYVYMCICIICVYGCVCMYVCTFVYYMSM